MIYRTQEEKVNKDRADNFTTEYSRNYWEPGLDECDVWNTRYEHEKTIILNICKENDIKTILELGSGPGKLSQIIINELPEIKYHLIDLECANQEFNNRGYKGKFFIKNLEDTFDTDGLLEKYDLIIMNDFIEHIRNPSRITSTCVKLMNDKSRLLVSIPNWRTSHLFIYRGLFDFDNFTYFLQFHKLMVLGIYRSPIIVDLKTEKTDNETMMPDDYVNSWNFYFLCEKAK